MMKTTTINKTDFLANTPISTVPTVVAIGMFDGVHAAHAQLISQASNLAKANNLTTTILSFELNDNANIHPSKRQQKLTTFTEKKARMQQLGVDELVTLELGKTIQHLSPEQFLGHLCQIMNVKYIVVGYDFRFGYQRTGDVDSLLSFAAQFGYQVQVVQKLSGNDQHKIGSSQIKTLLQNGDLAAANTLLGYPYTISGKVVHGKQQGRLLGFPTANVEIDAQKILVQNGVYITKTMVGDVSYHSFTNVGLAPTIKQMKTPVIETHLFDFNADIYDQCIQVTFLAKIRDEQKFASVDELIKQLKYDAQLSAEFFSKD